QRRAYLGQHAAGQGAVVDHAVDILGRDAGEQLAGLVEHARRIGEQYQLFGLEHFGDLAGDHVGIDVVGLAVGADADRRDYGNEGLAAEQRDQRGIDGNDVADLADV